MPQLYDIELDCLAVSTRAVSEAPWNLQVRMYGKATEASVRNLLIKLAEQGCELVPSLKELQNETYS